MALFIHGTSANAQLKKSSALPKKDTAAIEVFRNGEEPDRTYKELQTFTDNGRAEEEEKIEGQFLKKAAKLNADAMIVHEKASAGFEVIPFVGAAATFNFKATAIAYTGEPGSAPKATRSVASQPAAAPKSATGFFITEDGYLLTSAQVLNNASKVEVMVGDKVLPARIIKADYVNDVAILSVQGTFQALALSSSRPVKLGDSVFTLGFPDSSTQVSEPKLARGEISGLSGAKDDPREFETSVAIQTGHSGGPLVDQSGNVVAVISTPKAVGQAQNYALKTPFIFALFETLPENTLKLKAAVTREPRNLNELIAEVQRATVLVVPQ